MIKVRLFRDPNATGGGGADDSIVSVADLGKQVQPSGEEPPPAGEEPPVGETPPEGPVEGTNADGTLKPGYVTYQDKVMTEEEATKLKEAEAEGGETPPEVKLVDKDVAVDEEGKLREGFLENEDGTYAEDPDYEYESTPEDFWAEVDELSETTMPEDFDYGEDPLSPQAIAKREEFVRKDAIDSFENYLAKSNPKAYQYLLHQQAGGTDEEFFNKAKPTLPKREDFEASADIQSDWLKRDLLSKGVDADIVDLTIAKYVKENKLKEKGVELYDKLFTAEKDYLKELDELNRTKTEEFNGRVTQVLTDVRTTINSKELNIVIPKESRPGFEKFVQENIVHDGGKFYISQEISPENRKNLLEGLFLQYTKGDLSKIVAKKAKAETTQRLRLRVRKDRSTENRGGSAAPKKKGYVPLAELNKNK